MTLNLLLRNINDAHKEGDGIRTIECYRMALLYFKTFGHTKYSFSILRLLCSLKYDLHHSHELVFDQFINAHGLPGKNIPMDLHLEFLNRFLKEELKTLRSNLNEKNAQRVAESMNNIRTLVQNTEKNLEINHNGSGKNKYDNREMVKTLVKEASKDNPFIEDNRYKSYQSFEYFEEQILSKQDTTKLLEWTKRKSDEFKNLMELEKL